MSTPTPSQLAAVPSPASKKPGIHNVSTPTGAHGLSSPAPRSIPSPATTRKDLSGKTPLGHGTTGSSSGTKTVDGTPMMLNLSQQGSMASPMPAGLSGMTPTGLGVDVGTPGQLMNMSTPALAASMVHTFSDISLPASGLKRNEDDERRAKMRKILKTIGKPKGRVSEEGILRVTRRLGLANDIDGENLRAEERERRVGNRTIGIAGNTLVVEVELQKHVPKDVRVDFSNAMANAGGKAEQAGSILLNDLKQHSGPQVNAMLDHFALNLERLARFDRLSTTKVSCFGALAGLYTSLKRLYDEELKLASKLFENEDNREAKAHQRVINKESGHPTIHEDGLTGLSLEYWSDGVQYHKKADDAMDIDDNTVDNSTAQSRHRIWLETERCPSSIFPAIRISDTWLPDPLELSAAEAVPTPWLDPPPTYVSSEADGTNSMSVDSSQTLPDIRFVAKFDPPLILPWQIAASLYTAVESTIPPAFQLPSYFAMLLGASSGVTGSLFTTQAQVLRPSESGYVDVKHTYKINITKHEVGYSLEELPFSHPRQIIQLLPVLRQWLGINTLLLRHLNIASAGISPDANQQGKPNGNLLESLLADEQVAQSNELPVEVVLVLSPDPTLSLTFGLANGVLHNTDVQVRSNGELHVIDAEFSNAAEALTLCDDLGVWIEWLRSRKKS